LVPADAFYEWQKVGKGKQAHKITTKDQEIFSMAGLWEKWKSPEGEEIHSFTVITQEPNDVMRPIHNRMPAILTKDQEELWLADDLPPQELLDMIEPYPDDLLDIEPISNTFYKD